MDQERVYAPFGSQSEFERELARQPPTLQQRVRSLPVLKRARYLHFVSLFSAKKPVYENVEVLTPDGLVLCHCDKRKVCLSVCLSVGRERHWSTCGV
mmetsp:Transcript_21744/g.61850  ORF Transcript_21744/g.61850 Transcript_21744/m.61850 type:complete len:97 (-) Transcript_21744:1499-1789(-)